MFFPLHHATKTPFKFSGTTGATKSKAITIEVKMDVLKERGEWTAVLRVPLDLVNLLYRLFVIVWWRSRRVPVVCLRLRTPKVWLWRECFECWAHGLNTKRFEIFPSVCLWFKQRYEVYKMTWKWKKEKQRHFKQVLIGSQILENTTITTTSGWLMKMPLLMLLQLKIFWELSRPLSKKTDIIFS